MPDTVQPTGLIPDQLLSNIKKGDCVLFLGADRRLAVQARRSAGRSWPRRWQRRMTCRQDFPGRRRPRLTWAGIPATGTG